VKPGITGWAQVNGRNALEWEQKFTLDLWYLDNQSLFLDLCILARTAWHIFRRTGIAKSGYVTMPEFLGAKVKHKTGSA
jgi:sugar transferase EpsL